jgi:hypothetical protein
MSCRRSTITASHPATTAATTKDIYFPYLIPAGVGKYIFFVGTPCLRSSANTNCQGVKRSFPCQIQLSYAIPDSLPCYSAYSENRQAMSLQRSGSHIYEEVGPWQHRGFRFPGTIVTATLPSKFHVPDAMYIRPAGVRVICARAWRSLRVRCADVPLISNADSPNGSRQIAECLSSAYGPREAQSI